MPAITLKAAHKNILLILLIGLGLNLNASFKTADQMLLKSALNYNLAGVKAALSEGANVEDNAGYTALINATRTEPSKYTLPIIQELLNNHADANARDKWSYTPLLSATFYTNKYTLPIIKELLKHGADVNAEDKWGNTALSKLTAYNNKYTLPIIEKLLKHGANVNIKNYKNNTALLNATLNTNQHDLPIIKQLLERGADSHSKNTALLSITFGTANQL